MWHPPGCDFPSQAGITEPIFRFRTSGLRNLGIMGPAPPQPQRKRTFLSKRQLAAVLAQIRGSVWKIGYDNFGGRADHSPWLIDPWRSNRPGRPTSTVPQYPLFEIYPPKFGSKCMETRWNVF